MIRLEQLTVEHQSEPVGVDVRPRFGWVVTTDTPATCQTAWSIIVTEVDGREMWSSGIVTGDAGARSIDIDYDGAQLRSLRRYRWRVQVETTAGPAAAAGTFVTGVLDSDWHGAAWVAAASPTPAAPLLRCEFTVTDVPLEAYVVVAAGGLAAVELDGQPLDDAVLSPGFTDYDVRVQYTVTDVTSRIYPGRHAIGIELGRGFYGIRGRNTWNWETAPWHDDPCVRMLLLVRTAEGEQTIVTDEGWVVVDGPTTSDDLYAGEDYDARQARPEWSVAGSSAQDAVPVRTVIGPRGRLVAQRQPPIEVATLLDPVTTTALEDGRWVVSFPHVIAGWVELEADGDDGQTIELRFGETLRADGTPNCEDEKGYFDGRFQTDRLTLGPSPLRWRPRFTWHGFQHVEVRARRLPRLRAAVVHTRASRTGEFSSSVPLFNTIHELTVRTIMNNLHGFPTDTPKYEKNGWTGDGMLGARMMLQNLDVHELLAKWATDIADSRHGAGAPAVIAPFGGWTMDWSPAPTWHAALLLVPWEIYLQRGDDRVLRDCWPDARDYLRFELARCPQGIAETTLGDWVSPETDPGGGNAPEDPRISATAYLIAMCDTAARIAAIVGDPTQEWEEAAARSRAAFFDAFWDPVTAEVRGKGDAGYRQAHTVLALAFDVLPDQVRTAAADRLAADVRARGDHLSTGALATKYLLPVLTSWGYGDAAVAVARQRTFPSWGHWVEQGATSLWEHWNPESRSRGHYFLGTIDDWLYQDVAGLRPLAPGWRRARISPALIGHSVRQAAAAVSTPYGRLTVEWETADDGNTTLQCEVPVGVSAEIVLGGRTETVGSGVHHRLVQTSETDAAPSHQAE